MYANIHTTQKDINTWMYFFSDLFLWTYYLSLEEDSIHVASSFITGDDARIIPTLYPHNPFVTSNSLFFIPTLCNITVSHI